MYRYIVVTWSDAHASQRDAAQGVLLRIKEKLKDMRAVAGGRGFAALAADLRPGTYDAYLLTANRGVVFGKLFHSDLSDETGPSPVTFDHSASEAITSTQGKHLLDRYWGRYIAFIRDDASETMNIIRDPSGSIFCFVCEYRNVRIAFSYAEDCIALDLIRFSINWKYVFARLGGRSSQAPFAGLNEILQLRPGERMSLHRDGFMERTLLWNPLLISESDPITDADFAIKTAGRMIRKCLSAWASCYSNIVLRYSGGFDSTIVLRSLREAASQPKVTCLNYFDAPAEVKEREYLRRAIDATSAGITQPVELLEFARCPETVDLKPLLNVKRFACLPYYKGWLMGEPYDTAVAIERNAALFDGIYGDQLFLSDTTYAAIDFLWHHPMWETARRTASGRSMEEILWSALTSMLHMSSLESQQKPQVQSADYPFINPDVFTELQSHEEDYLVRYWLQRQPPIVPPGKRRHILMMCAPANLNCPFPDRYKVERVTPLASQPLMELFLRMPTYVLNSGELNRTVARKAFWEYLPEEFHSESAVDIGRREGGNSRHLTVLRQNEAFTRDILLDGRLAKEKILNRQAVERYLTECQKGRADGDVDLLEICFDMEIWLRSWSSLTPPSPQNS